MIEPSSTRGMGLALMHVTRLLRKHFDRRAVRFELTRSQWRALRTIHHHEGLSQTELADLLELEPIPVGRVIDRLEESAYVERRPDPNDRRRWCLHLTNKAREVLSDIHEIADGLRADALTGVAKDDYVVFDKVLQQIKANLTALDETDIGKQP